MGELSLFKTYNHYNRWMNEKIYAVCAGIPDTVRKKDMNAFFRSIHGTLNHILLADRIWLGRFTGQPCTFTALDEDLYDDFEELRQEREQTDNETGKWIDSLNEDSLQSTLTFTSITTQKEHTLQLQVALLHFFNHQTHHRGQVTALLSQLGADFGITDLIHMPGIQP